MHGDINRCLFLNHEGHKDHEAMRARFLLKGGPWPTSLTVAHGKTLSDINPEILLSQALSSAPRSKMLQREALRP